MNYKLLSLTIKKQRKFVQFVAKQKNFTKFAFQIRDKKYENKLKIRN